MAQTGSVLADPAFYADPYATYAAWRREAPVRWEPALNGWCVTTHADITHALADPCLSSDRTDQYLAVYPATDRDGLEPFARARRDMLLFVDPPKHTRLRGLVQKAFTPKMIERLRPQVERLVDELLAPMARGGEHDLIATLAEPLPGLVIAELLGVPAGDRSRIKGWAADFVAAISGGRPLAVVHRAQDSLRELADYLGPIMAERRRDPEDDLLSALVAVEDQGDLLSQTELVATCMLLLIAGSETTTNLIGNGTLALLRHRDQLERWRGGEVSARSAVEELLRYDSPVQATFRAAREATAIHGVPIEPGQGVALVLGAANHDPEAFLEPHRLDLGRENRRHLAFSHGPHFCLGAALARLEGQVALKALVDRFPSLQLATDQPSWRPLFAFRGLQTLPVSC